MNLTILHLYPDLLNLYGDRGNIQCMVMRSRWRGIGADVVECTLDDRIDFSRADIVLLGGGSDREQQIVCTRLQSIREDFVRYVEDGGTVIAVCGGYQLLGHYYDSPQGRMEGLSLVDLYTEQGSPRLISNVILQSDEFPCEIVGFENHGGRTYIGVPSADGRLSSGSAASDGLQSTPSGGVQGAVSNGVQNPFSGGVQGAVSSGVQNAVSAGAAAASGYGNSAAGGSLRPLGRVLYGYGNNGEDGLEGVLYKNVIGTYLHGPLLPKNPHVCDRLLQTALDRKYGRGSEITGEPVPDTAAHKGNISLAPLDDRQEMAANRAIVNRFMSAKTP